MHRKKNVQRYYVFGLQGFPLIKPGDDISKFIVETAKRNGLKIENDDVIVVAQKIVSKSENRLVRLKEIVPSQEARRVAKITKKSPKFVHLVLEETNHVKKASSDILLVKDRRGIVCINAGIDKSNIEGKDKFALLPEDPDRSAENCRLRIKELTGKDVGVIVCDSYSRPFRRGQVNFAIGISGIEPFKDYRGKRDLFGQILKVKNVAVADEIASAAELLMGQAQEATPVVVFKGLRNVVKPQQKWSAKSLGISELEDLFREAL